MLFLGAPLNPALQFRGDASVDLWIFRKAVVHLPVAAYLVINQCTYMYFIT